MYSNPVDPAELKEKLLAGLNLNIISDKLLRERANLSHPHSRSRYVYTRANKEQEEDDRVHYEVAEQYVKTLKDGITLALRKAERDEKTILESREYISVLEKKLLESERENVKMRNLLKETLTLQSKISSSMNNCVCVCRCAASRVDKPISRTLPIFVHIVDMHIFLHSRSPMMSRAAKSTPVKSHTIASDRSTAVVASKDETNDDVPLPLDSNEEPTEPTSPLWRNFRKSMSQLESNIDLLGKDPVVVKPSISKGKRM
jgi:hypothetical protein